MIASAESCFSKPYLTADFEWRCFSVLLVSCFHSPLRGTESI